MNSSLLELTLELPEEGLCRGFTLPIEGAEPLEGFVVNLRGSYLAYRNHCPHVGAPLDWMPDQFLDPAGRFIQCSMHGALFDIGSGACVAGPCAGQGLTPLALELRQGKAFLKLG